MFIHFHICLLLQCINHNVLNYQTQTNYANIANKLKHKDIVLVLKGFKNKSCFTFDRTLSKVFLKKIHTLN